MRNYIKSALNSIWNNKVRSVLNVLGVIIGVASVATLISLGQGLKNDVSGLIRGFGTNVIFVVAGKIDTSGAQATQNPANFISGDILTLDDYKTIESLPEIEHSTPLSLVGGNLKYNDKSAAPTLAGTYPSAIETFDVFSLESGRMFSSQSSTREIVLAQNIKKQLFGDVDAVGKSITLGKDQFEVVGVLNKIKSSSIFGGEFDNLSLLPFDEATRLNKNQVRIARIAAKVSEGTDVKAVKDKIFKAILQKHNNEENFSVLTQDDLLGLFDQFLNIATAMVSAIAAISLIVGGIGIMNIMLVTVTERTKEIGLRKAVGATRRAIAWQFLIESVVVTFVGGAIGLGVAMIADFVVKKKTPLSPVLSLNVILIAVGISMVIGIIFGLWPALKAANKDPIEALRYE